MTMPVAPTFAQAAFRARTNVTDPSDQDAAFDAGDTALNTNWTQDTDTLIRVRFLVQQTEATAVNHPNLATEFRLQYNNTTAVSGWTTVGAAGTSAEDVVFVGGAPTDNSITNSQLLGSGTLVDGEYIEDQDTGTISFTAEALTETEIEVAIQIVGANVTDADDIDLRLIFSDADESPPATAFNDATPYPQMPTMTVNKVGGSVPEIPLTHTVEPVRRKPSAILALGYLAHALVPLAKLDLTLKQGTTTIASWTDQELTSAEGDLTLSLTQAQLDSIGYPASNLTLDVTSTEIVAGEARVLELYLTAPAVDPSPPAEEWAATQSPVAYANQASAKVQVVAY